MHPTKTFALLTCFLVVAVSAPADADDSAESMTARLRARAETPTQPAVERPDLRGLPVPDRLFYMRATDHIRCVRSIADVNGDGRDEVIVGIDESQADNIFCLDGASSGEATVVWSQHPISGVSNGSPYGDDSIVPISDPDVNGDGDHDVLAAVGEDVDRLVCLDGGTTNPAGHVLWTYSPGTSVYAAGVLPDITGDRHPDIVVSSWENAVIVLNGLTGGLVWKTTVGTLNGGDVWTARAIDDLNADGFQDVVAGSFDTYAYAMDGTDGTELWSYPTGYRVYSI